MYLSGPTLLFATDPDENQVYPSTQPDAKSVPPVSRAAMRARARSSHPRDLAVAQLLGTYRATLTRGCTQSSTAVSPLTDSSSG
jgi:hypothetical protein